MLGRVRQLCIQTARQNFAAQAARTFCAAAPTIDAAPANNTASPSWNVALKPSEIVEHLDRHIIGQADAKKAIAIALRNRWRRLQLNEMFQEEIIPRNILMVGPTGVGKTEIARRLAKLVNAPFVKVEATKFTEVGYHGRDVDTIIRDLVDNAMSLVRQIKSDEYKEEVTANVETRILEALAGPEARDDTVESLRDLLRAGSLDDREISIELPAAAPSNDYEVNIPGGATIDLSEMIQRMNGGGRRPRMEKRKLSIAQSRPLLFDQEMERKLGSIDFKKEAVELAEQHGIVFIDEIDKIVSDRSRHNSDASAEGVQRDLLPLIEGSSVDCKRFGNVKTDHILFVASGAFHDCKPSDMLAELQGRLPIRVQLKGLGAAELKQILTEPQFNIIAQQIALIGAEGLTITFEPDAIEEIANLAAEMNRVVENIGARRLHTVMEKIMEDISFGAADREPGDDITITKELVQEKLGAMVKKTDLSKFIL